MIPLAVPNLTGNERCYLNDCIDTTFVSSVGPYVTRLEELVAQKTDSASAVATSSGTTALHLALMGVGVSRDELVLVPSFTFIASVNAIAHCGASPWFVDIDPEDWTIDAWQLEKELESCTTRTNNGVWHKTLGRRVAAIMPVYTLGNVADMDSINRVAEAYGLPVVADAACAIGARYKNRGMGSLATLSIVSFNGNKTVTAGGGGSVFGNDETLVAHVKHVSTTGRILPDYDFDCVGYNYRMTNLQAAVGCAQMERLDSFLQKKREIRECYCREFADLDGVSFFPESNFGGSSCWFSGIVLQKGGIGRLHEIESRLRSRGVESRMFWKPAHLQPPYKSAPRAKSLDVSESLWDRVLTLPCSTGLTEDEQKMVVSAVKDVIGEMK